MKNRVLRFLRKGQYLKLKYLGNQAGSMLMDFVLAAALVSGVMILVYQGFGRASARDWEQAKVTTFMGTMVQLNNSRTAHGGTYPAAAAAGAIVTAATTTVSGAVSAYVGSNSTDIATWTYKCVAAGSSMIIGVVDGNTPSGGDAQVQLITDIVAIYGASVVAGVATNATTTTFTISGTTCQ